MTCVTIGIFLGLFPIYNCVTPQVSQTYQQPTYSAPPATAYAPAQQQYATLQQPPSAPTPGIRYTLAPEYDPQFEVDRQKCESDVAMFRSVGSPDFLISNSNKLALARLLNPCAAKASKMRQRRAAGLPAEDPNDQ